MADYNKLSKRQVTRGKEFLEKMACVKQGQTVLDLGCGTGQLSCYIAELVAPSGQVIAVDPDEKRIRIARESYRHVKNLTFAVGGSQEFPNMDHQTYDLIVCSSVLHWIPQKEHVFLNAYRTLKPGGKIAVKCMYEMIPMFEKAAVELFCEVADDMLSMVRLEDMAQVEQFCVESGLKIKKCCKITNRETFDTKLEFCEWMSAAFHGRADLKLLTPERLEAFSPPTEHGKVIMERPTVLHLVAVKPELAK